MHQPQTDLEDVRAAIDRCDETIVDAIAERTDLAADVAEVKAESGRDLVDADRERAVKAQYAERFEAAGLEADHGRALAALLIDVALAREHDVTD